jgi:NSS family neurotransmitter:Na+ symporter
MRKMEKPHCQTDEFTIFIDGCDFGDTQSHKFVFLQNIFLTMDHPRTSWNSKLGFILAASGSAIGLGNIVFFSSNAYQHGGGAFYLPYFLALFVLGIPIMMLEFGLGATTRKSFPLALRQVAGRRAEFVGWWAIGCAAFITMYYLAILGWAFGMMLGAFGSLFESGQTAPFTPFSEPSPEPSAMVFFFRQLATWNPLIFTLIIWGLNLLILKNGTSSIEKAVKIFVPLMWLCMIGLIIRGLSLEGGFQGALYLFTPDVRGITDPGVWRGAFSQMFFSLSLGLGALTTYASYLPKKSDLVNNAMLVSFLNCSFEYLAGLAVFSLLFVFALNPAGSTLSLSFFVIPQGINGLSELPWIVRLTGFGFFALLVMAGLTSSLSLIENPASALIDKLGISRNKALTLIAIPGIPGSILFVLPFIIDPDLNGNGTLGLTLLDITDHWVFSYSLLTIGLITALIIGWWTGAEQMRQALNQYASIKLGRWFNPFIKFVIPAILISVILSSLAGELHYENGAWTYYGSTYKLGSYWWLLAAVPTIWIGSTLTFAWVLTYKSGRV